MQHQYHHIIKSGRNKDGKHSFHQLCVGWKHSFFPPSFSLVLASYWCLSLLLISASPFPAVHGTMDCGQKSFKLVWRCHKLLSRFLANGLFLQCHVSHVCQLMSDNDIIWGLCTGYLAFALKPRKNLENVS